MLNLTCDRRRGGPAYVASTLSSLHVGSVDAAALDCQGGAAQFQHHAGGSAAMPVTFLSACDGEQICELTVPLHATVMAIKQQLASKFQHLPFAAAKMLVVVLLSVLWGDSERFPVKLQARELGADISYCLKKAAKVRNERIAIGHHMVRLAGLPLSPVHKQRLLFSSVFPQSLQASEIAIVPKSVYARLPSKTALSSGTAKKGSNPFLACLLACPRIVDPQFF